MLLQRHRAEDAQDLDKAAQYLSRFISLNPEDAPAWAWYARVMDRKSKPGRSRELAYQVSQYAVRFNPDDLGLRRRGVEIALELEQYPSARKQLDDLIKAAEDAKDDARAAELQDWLGRCHQGERQFDKAEMAYREALRRNNTRISTSDRLARMLRTDMKSPGPADAAVDEMVRRNPASAQGPGLSLALSPRIRLACRQGRRGPRTAARPR